MTETYEPYEAPEDIAGYGEDRIGCGPLTLLNTVALGIGLLGGWKLTGALGLTGPNFSVLWWVQGALIVASGLAGVLLTIRFGGLALLERLALWLSWRAERLSGRATIAPHALGVGRARTGGALPIGHRDGTQLLSAPYHGKEHRHAGSNGS